MSSFAVLGWIGTRIYQEMPPIPAKIVDTTGAVVVAEGDIGRGQNVWQALGGMEVGSVWGHGSYVAPDWTADWLHRESTFVLDEWGNAEFGKPYAQLSAEDQGKLRGRLEGIYRRNGYDRGLPHHHDCAGARAGVRGLPGALLRRLHEGQCVVCHPQRQRIDSAAHAAVRGLPVLDVLVGIGQSPRRYRFLHAQLAV